MDLFATARRFGVQAVGGVVACVLLLPLPALAFTIGGWTFQDNGIALADNSSDHKTLTFAATSGGANYSALGFAPISGSPGEPVYTFLDLSGLTLIRGNVVITVNINDVGSESKTLSAPTGSNFQGYISPAPLDLTGSSGEVLKITFQFSNNALFTYNSSTAGNIFFRGNNS